MKSWGLAAKILAAGCALALSLAVAVPFIIKKYLPPEKVRGMILSSAQRSLGRQVRLGDVSYSLLKGLTLHELAVSEAPDFQAGTFVAARQFHVRLRWLPLLRREVDVDAIAADGLRLSVVRRKDGRYNFSDIAGSTVPASTAAAPVTGAASAGSLRVGRVDISDGEVQYRDLASDDEVALSAISAKVRGFRLSGPVGVELAFAAKGHFAGRLVDGSAAYAGTIDLGGSDPAKFSAQFKKLVVAQQGLHLRAAGAIAGLAPPKAKLTLSLYGPRGELLDGSLAAEARLPAIAADFDVKTPGFSGADLAFLGAPGSLAVPALKAAGAAAWSDGKLVVKKLRVEGAVGAVDLSGVVRGFDPKKPDADVDFSADLSLPPLAAKDYPQLGLPAGLTLPASQVAAKGHLADDDLRLDSLRLKTVRGTVEASGAVKRLLSSKPDVALSAKSKLELPELTAADLPFVKLPAAFVSPAMAVDASVKAAGDDLTISALHVKGKAGTVDVSGTVKKVRSDFPEPNLEVSAKLELPALTARDIPSREISADFALPSSQWDVAVAGSLDELKIKRLRLRVGKNDVEIADARVAGMRTRMPLFSVLIKCRSFVLDELKKLTASTKEMDISGSGFFALEVTGKWPKPILAGKAQFRDLAAVVGGLPLSAFTGTASFDERRIDVPNLKGKVADGDLSVDLTIKDYAKRPDVDLEAALTRFDLGRFLAAKAVIAQKKGAEAVQQAEARHNAEPIDLKGRLTVGRLLHPNAEAENVKLTWQLTSFTPDLKHLAGAATLLSNGGKFSNLGSMASQSKLVKVLVFPLMIFQKIGSIGGIKLFPDFNNVVYSELAGDYAFRDGEMTLNDSHLNSSAGNVTATGKINLPREELDMTVTAQVARLAPLDVAVTGTFDKPSSHVKIGKFLADPAKQLLRNIFRPQ